MYLFCIIMIYKVVHIKKDTDDLLDVCIKDFIGHHPEFKNIRISRNKIIHDIAIYYLKN